MKIRKEFNGFSRSLREIDITEMVLSRTEVKGEMLPLSVSLQNIPG